MTSADHIDGIQSSSSSNTFEKSGNAGSKAYGFLIDITIVTSLNAYCSHMEWKLSTVNKKAGKYGDVVLECPDGAILLQTKHKEDKMEMITKDDLFPIGPGSDEFSLARYFVSYHREIKNNFPIIKNCIICTNRSLDSDTEDLVTRQVLTDGMILYHEEDEYTYVTFKEKTLSNLKQSVKSWIERNKRVKDIDKIIASDENLQAFLKRLQFYPSYPTGNVLGSGIEQLLSCKNLPCKTYLNLYSEIEKWFKLKHSVYLNKRYVDIMFLEIRRDNHWRMLEQYDMQFLVNDLKHKKRHVVIDMFTSHSIMTQYFLQELRIFHALKDEREKVLYIKLDHDADTQKQVIAAFELPKYIFLIIFWRKITRFNIELCTKLKGILKEYNYKRTVLVSEDINKFILQMAFNENTYDVIDKCLMQEDLTECTWNWMLEKKNDRIQAIAVHMEILLNTLSQNKHNHDQHVAYIERRFKKKIKNDTVQDKMLNNVFSEVEIINSEEKVLLISDIAGSGKSTSVTNLAVTVKTRHPDWWVIKLELYGCIEVLRNLHHQGEELTLTKLLGLNSYPENEKIVLMLDGLDEINSDYRDLVLNMLMKCKDMPDFTKIFITTRPHMTQLLEIKLEAKTFTFQAFDKKDQVKCLTNSLMHYLRLTDSEKEKCERYANVLRNGMHFWTKADSYTDHHFIGIPLQAKMLAEVFQDNSEMINFESCKQFINSDNEELKLPESIDVTKLYEMFINMKRQSFISEGNTRSEFDRILSYHHHVALKVIFGETNCIFFSKYREISDSEKDSTLNLGLVQKINNKLHFVHRTFPEYFVGRSVLEELRFRRDVFERFFFEEVLADHQLGFVRALLNCQPNDLEATKFFKNCQLLKNKTYCTEMKGKCTFLHVLAKEGCVEILHLVCRYGTLDIDIEDDKDRTPLYYAVKHNRLEAAGLLVKNKANVNAHHDQHSSPLVAAVSYGNIEMVQFLMAKGANFKVRGYEGCKILYDAVGRKHAKRIANCLLNCVWQTNEFTTDFAVAYTAAYLGELDILKKMVDRELNIDNRTETGETLIFAATRGGQVDIIKYLKQHGAEISAKDNYGNTALHLASMDQSLVPTLELLIKLKINVSCKNSIGHTALQNAVKCDILKAVNLLVINGREEVTQRISEEIEDGDLSKAAYIAASWKNYNVFVYLVERGADVNVANKAGRTPLHLFALDGHHGMVQFLLGREVVVNKPDDSGRTALHEAAWKGHRDIVEVLLEHSADVKTKDSFHCTPLHFAASEGYLDVVNLLVPLVEDVDVTDKAGWTALHYAASKGHFDVVKLLLDQEATITVGDNEGRTPLHSAAERDHLNILKFLIEKGADVTVKSAIGYTALHEAASRGRLHTVKELLKCPIDLNAKDNDDCTALYEAAAGLHWNVVDVLVQHRANVNIGNRHDRTVLHCAALHGRLDTIQLLVNYNGNVDSKDNQGKTALHEAAANNHIEIIEFLVEQGATLNLKDKRRFTAQKYAAFNDNSDIVRFLKSRVRQSTWEEKMDTMEIWLFKTFRRIKCIFTGN